MKVRDVLFPDGRRSRLHTQRGEFVGPGKFREVGLALLDRLGLKSADGPWMTPDSIVYLRRCLNEETRLIELGSGRSTLWYAARCGDVVSVEPHDEWARVVKAMLAAERVEADIRETSISAALQDLLSTQNTYDTCVVDFTETDCTRVDAVRWAAKMQSIRRIVLDDSDRPAYQEAFSDLRSWECHRFPGFRGHPFAASETTIFERRI